MMLQWWNMVDEWNPECSFTAVQEAFDELGTMWGGFGWTCPGKQHVHCWFHLPFVVRIVLIFFGTIYKLKRRMVKKRHNPTKQDPQFPEFVTKKLVTMLNKCPKTWSCSQFPNGLRNMASKDGGCLITKCEPIVTGMILGGRGSRDRSVGVPGVLLGPWYRRSHQYRILAVLSRSPCGRVRGEGMTTSSSVVFFFCWTPKIGHHGDTKKWYGLMAHLKSQFTPENRPSQKERIVFPICLRHWIV